MQRDTLVSFEGVVKRFGGFVAVKKLDFEIKKGEFLAIMGSSGCGKTTTLRMLAGLEAPTEGVIRLSGKPINDLPTWSRDTPMVWQSLALFPFLNVRENVEFALKMRGVGKAERRRRAEQWLDRMQITEFSPNATSASFPAASGSGWRWPGRWSWSRKSSSSTNPCRRWTRRSRCGCSRC
jgi:spermidine/putrescine transport system ATP-binding protein